MFDVDFNVGASEPGSWGAPLFDDKAHVVGTLFNSTYSSSLDNCTALRSYASKLSSAWNYGEDSARSLSSHLDPDDMGVLQMEGKLASAFSAPSEEDLSGGKVHHADFESDDSKGWFSTGSSGSSWSLDEARPTLPMLGGTKRWTTASTPAGDPQPREDSYLYSPLFNVPSGKKVFLVFTMWYQLTPAIGDGPANGLNVEHSFDRRDWRVLGSAGDENWYTSDHIEGLAGPGWTGSSGRARRYYYALPAHSSARKVSFRFHLLSHAFSLPQAGVAIDDISVHALGKNVAVLDVETPSLPSRVDVSNAVRFRVANLGTDDLSNVAVSYQLNGELARSAHTLSSLASGDAAVHTLTGLSLEDSGNEVEILVNFAGDEHVSDNSFSISLTDPT